MIENLHQTKDTHLRVPNWVHDAAKAQGLTDAQYILRACVRLHEGKQTPIEARDAILMVSTYTEEESTQPVALMRKLALCRGIVVNMMVD